MHVGALSQRRFTCYKLVSAVPESSFTPLSIQEGTHVIWQDSVKIRRLRSHNYAAMEEIYDEYADRVKQYVMQQTRSGDRAEELTHLTFLKLFWKVKLNNLATKLYRSINHLLCAFAKGYILEEVHREKKARKIREELLKLPRSSPARPDEKLLRKEIRTRVGKAVDRLPPKYREAVILAYLQEHPLEETAILMDASKDTTKKRLWRARKLLARALRRFWKGDDE